MKHQLKYSEFYITNVCNYACNNCNRFNNFNLKGFQRWADYKDEYEKFAERLEIKRIGILGGEPFLNPDLYNWIDGIANLWPKAKIKITTNGSRKKDEKLFDMLMKYQGRVYLEYSCHDKNYYYSFHDSIIDFLPDCNYTIEWDIQKWDDIYPSIRGSDWPIKPLDITNENNFDYIKTELIELGIEIELFQKTRIYYIEGTQYATLEPAWWFNNTAIKSKDDNLYAEATSNIEKAHDICYSKNCHHFVNGTFAKCMIPYSLKEAIDQTNISISDEDYKMLTSYKPLTPDQSEKDFNKFIEDINNPIEQCKFCPEYFTSQEISIIEKNK